MKENSNLFKEAHRKQEESARAHQNELTKPAGSLGRLEQIAIQLAGLQKVPTANRVSIFIFAADHGVVAQGISKFPQCVTAQMVANFANGGAAINVLARLINAKLNVCVLGLVDHSQLSKDMKGVQIHKLAAGTQDFTKRAAMEPEQLEKAMHIGAKSVLECQSDLYIAGEMGIGNTTSASAITAALLNCNAQSISGTGTGIDEKTRQKKAQLIEQALQFHKHELDQPLSVLRCVGGLEIAAITGAYIECAKQGIPALVDGFITSAAALVAVRAYPKVRPWLLFSHKSKEPGHTAQLESLKADPILDLNMHLGEGSGAALAVSVVRAACAIHRQMHTFSQAQVSSAKKS